MSGGVFQDAPRTDESKVNAMMARPRLSYHLRVMGATAVVLLLAIGLVEWWPTWSALDSPVRYHDRPTERIQVQEITPTSQSQELNPPPPAPLPPIVVPNDVIVKEEVEIGESSLQIETPGEDERLQEGASTAPTAARQPDTDGSPARHRRPPAPQRTTQLSRCRPKRRGAGPHRGRG